MKLVSQWMFRTKAHLGAAPQIPDFYKAFATVTPLRPGRSGG